MDELPVDSEPGSEEPAPLPAATLALRVGLGVLGLFLLCSMVQLLNIGFGLWFTELFAILGFSWMCLRLTGRDPIAYPRASFPGAASVALGFIAGVVNFGALVVPLEWLMQTVSPHWLKEVSFDSSQIFNHQNSLELALIISAVGVAAPICEEYFFRGIFQQGLMSRLKPTAAIWVAAAVFSAFHFDAIGFPARLELGILFGLLFARTGSLWPGIAAHAANNLVSTSLFFIASKNEQPGDSNEPKAWYFAALVLAGAPIVFAVTRASIERARTLRLGSPGPEPLKPRPTARQAVTMFAAWAGAGLAAVGALYLVDPRGIQLNVFDQTVHLADHPDNLGDDEKAQREELESLRLAARRGEIPLERYYQRRRELAVENDDPKP